MCRSRQIPHRCVFRDKDKEVIYDYDTYVVGYGDNGLKPDYGKKLSLNANIGFSNPDDLPPITAELYINDILLETVVFPGEYKTN